MFPYPAAEPCRSLTATSSAEREEAELGFFGGACPAAIIALICSGVGSGRAYWIRNKGREANWSTNNRGPPKVTSHQPGGGGSFWPGLMMVPGVGPLIFIPAARR